MKPSFVNCINNLEIKYQKFLIVKNTKVLHYIRCLTDGMKQVMEMDSLHKIELHVFILNNKSKLTEFIQTVIAWNDPFAVFCIIKTGIIPSEAVQMAAVLQNSLVFKSLIRAGIKPSEAVKKAADQQAVTPPYHEKFIRYITPPEQGKFIRYITLPDHLVREN